MMVRTTAVLVFYLFVTERTEGVDWDRAKMVMWLFISHDVESAFVRVEIVPPHTLKQSSPKTTLSYYQVSHIKFTDVYLV